MVEPLFEPLAMPIGGALTTSHPTHTVMGSTGVVGWGPASVNNPWSRLTSIASVNCAVPGPCTAATRCGDAKMPEAVTEVRERSDPHAALFVYEITDDELEAAAENGLGARCSCKPCKSKCSLSSR